MRRRTHSYAALGALIAGFLIVLVWWRFAYEHGAAQPSSMGADIVQVAPPVGDRSFTQRIEPRAAPLPPPSEEVVRSAEAEARPLIGVAALGSIFMVIRDFDSQPLFGVSVTLRSGAGHEAAFTDFDGAAAFEGIAPGKYSYVIEAPAYPPLMAAAPLELASGEEKVLELRLADFDRGIRGRVLNQYGEPVEGLAVTARLHRVQRDAQHLVPRFQSEQEAQTSTDGSFEIAGLLEGEYAVRTLATDRYSSARAIVRAGVDAAALMVAERWHLTISGRVTSPDGEALADVKVVYLGQPSRRARTDETGWYELVLSDGGTNGVHRFHFYREGFQAERIELTEQALRAQEQLRLDAILEPVGQIVEVFGRLMDEQGTPVVGERVHLYSRRLKINHEAVSGPQGSFDFPDVWSSSDYHLWVSPAGSYEDYRQSLDPTVDWGPLEIVLESLSVGKLAGQMVDAQGYPVPYFSLWLRNEQARGKSLQVTGNADGYFEVEKFPAGSLTLQTRSSPQLRISGIRLDANSEKYVELILDWGEATLEGRISDVNGNPLASARVNLDWRDSENAVHSRSTRKTATDNMGWFQFTRLGPGTRRLSVSADGFRNTKRVLGSGVNWVAVQLE